VLAPTNDRPGRLIDWIMGRQAYTLFLAREHAEDFMAHPVLSRHIAEGRLWLVCDNFGPARIRCPALPLSYMLLSAVFFHDVSAAPHTPRP
jgi:hypothetical protein